MSCENLVEVRTKEAEREIVRVCNTLARVDKEAARDAKPDSARRKEKRLYNTERVFGRPNNQFFVSLSSSARSFISAALCLPWASSTAARLLTLVSVLGCSFPSAFSLPSSARRFIVSAASYLPWSIINRAALTRTEARLRHASRPCKSKVDRVFDTAASTRKCYTEERDQESVCSFRHTADTALTPSATPVPLAEPIDASRMSFRLVQRR
nr:hypothetical protein CFP56_02867 [Quercus suber]